MMMRKLTHFILLAGCFPSFLSAKDLITEKKNTDDQKPYLLLDRSYYTKEKTANIKIYLPGEASKEMDHQKAQISALLKDGTNHIVSKESGEMSVNTSFCFGMDISNLPVGTYSLETVLKENDREIAHFSEHLQKLAPVPNEVKINRFSRMLLVNDEPFVPIMSSAEFYGDQIGGAPEGALKKVVEESGFNTLCLWCVYSDESVAACEKAGIKFVLTVPFSLQAKTGKELTDGLVQNAKKHKDSPFLIGWLIADEGGIQGTEEEFKQRYRALKEADPYHPIFRNDCGWVIGYGGPGGLESTDLYCGDYGGGRLVDAINYDAIPRGAPSLALQGFWGPPEQMRYPTPAEINEWFYEVMVHGACGGFWWGAHDLNLPIPGYWKAIKQIADEMKSLTPVLNSPAVKNHVECDHRGVNFTLRKSEDGYDLIAVNTLSQSQKVVFNLDPALFEKSGTAKRLFESGDVAYQNGELPLKFNPLERQVYHFK